MTTRKRLFPAATALTALVLAPGALPAPHAPAAGIEWRPDYAAALAEAAAGGRVVFVAVNMDGERANDRMAEEVYRDKLVRELAARTVPVVASTFEHAQGRACPRFGAVSCDDHRRVDTAVREGLLKPDAQGFVVAPQHVFLDPQGEVLLSVPYEVRVEELAWCFVTALAAVDPATAPRMPADARAPKRLILGDVYDLAGANGGRPLTRDEVVALVKEVKKGKLPNDERERAIRDILAADEPEAIDFMKDLMRSSDGGGRRGGGGGAGRQARYLRWMGIWSPRSYWEVVAEFAVGGRDELRREAVVALEQIGAPEAGKAVAEGLRKEKDPTIEKDLLRALASVGAAESGTLKTLARVIEREKDQLLRVNAIVGLGHLVPGDDVRALLTELLEVPEEQRADLRAQRVAAVCAMGFSRDAHWKERLVATAAEAAERQDAELAAACAAALEVLEAGDLAPLGGPIGTLCQDQIRRARFFGPDGA